MKKLATILISTMLMITMLIVPQGQQVKAATTTIDLLSINDFHGRLEQAGKDPGLARVTGYIKQYQATNPDSAVLAAGDLFQGSPLSNLTKGESTAKALKELNIQYSAIGNHEFDWGSPQNDIPKWETVAGFPFLAANIYDTKTGKRVTFAKPTAMITVSGKKVGLIGIATPETAYKTNLANVKDLEFKDPVSDINTFAADLKTQGADAIVVLSHLGCMQDEKTGVITGEAAEAAKKVTGVDAIITGHTHQTIQGKVNGVSIVQAASYGRAVAHTKIDFDAAGKVSNVTPKVDNLIPQIATLPVHQPTADIIATERGKLASLLDVPVANNPSELKHGRYDGLSTLGQYFSYLAGQQLVDKGYLDKQPIVIMNGGGFRDSIAAGTITQGTMYNILPFDNFLVTMDLTKDQVKKNIENGILNADVGWVQYSGLTVYYDPTKPAGDRITEMYYTPTNEKGEQTGLTEELVDGKLYKVVTNDFMFTGGDKYDFKNAQNVKTYDGDLLRDSVQAQLKKFGTIAYNQVPRLLTVPDQANKLPEFSTELASFEYDVASGKMFKVDTAGKKTELSGTNPQSMIESMLKATIGANDKDVSNDYNYYKLESGTLIEALAKVNGKTSELESGKEYTVIVTATDGKVSPKKTRAGGPVYVTKTYTVKTVGTKAAVGDKTSTTQTSNKKNVSGSSTLPATGGEQEYGFVGIGLLITIGGIASYILRKKC